MNSKQAYSLDELMVVEAARHISDWDTVMVGTGLPMVASLFALKNHAPNMCYVVETGGVAPQIVGTPNSVTDARVMHRAVRHGSLIDALGGILQRGLADVAFLGGAQIDRYANVNSTVIGNHKSPKVRFPGSGGANDLASHAKKILIITRHEKRRFPEKCDFITSPGYIDGPHGREKAGLTSQNPDILVITNLAVLGIDKTTGCLQVSGLMPGISIDQVQDNTGFELMSSADLSSIQPPTAEELCLLREEVDPEGEYIGSSE